MYIYICTYSCAGSPSASPLAVVELDLMQPLDPNK